MARKNYLINLNEPRDGAVFGLEYPSRKCWRCNTIMERPRDGEAAAWFAIKHLGPI